MDKDRKRKQAHFMFAILLIFALYVGYCIGTLGDGYTIKADTIMRDIQRALLSPLPIRVTGITKTCVFFSVVIWLLIYVFYLGNIRNYMPEKEYGTARFAQPEEINKKLQYAKEPSQNKILSENLRMGLDDELTGRNDNAVYIGGSGAGKSFRCVRPNLFQCNSSFIVTDPKGELLRDTGNFLRMKGHTIKVLNLVQMLLSNGYNPFRYIRSENDIIRLITNLIANTTPKNANMSDPFWEKAEAMYLQAIFLYVWLEYPKQGESANFRGVLELLNEAEVIEDDRAGKRKKSQLDKRMAALPSQHPARISYHKVQSGAGDTIRSIIISANARLTYLQNPEILRILDQDEMDIPFLGEGVYENPERKMALFCVIPDNDKSYNFLVGLLYTQIFQELYYIADHKYKHSRGKLPVHVAFWLDEFANVALPDSFPEILSTCRSRNIGINIIIQNVAQLKTLFKDAWESIIGNCDTLVYLGGNEQSTHKYMSDMLDRMTIDKRSTGETRGSHGSSSRNYDVLGRELLRPGEVRKLNNEKCLVLIRGFDPVLDLKYQTWKKAEFKESMALGIYVDEHELERQEEEERRQFYFDLSGDEGKEKSYHFQTEQYQGIFEESAIYQYFQIEGGIGKLPKEFGGYYYDDTEVWPIFDVDAEGILAGTDLLKKHRLIGYYSDCELKMAEKELLQKIFQEANRLAASWSKMDFNA